MPIAARRLDATTLAAALTALACQGGASSLARKASTPSPNPAPASPTATGVAQAGVLAAFATDDALTVYLSGLAQTMVKNGVKPDGTKAGVVALPQPTPIETGGIPGSSSSSSSSQPPVTHAITNVQEAGVDEPDVVKSIGDSLVVLDGAKLYVMSVAAGQAATATDSAPIETDASLVSKITYQGLLVDSDTVIVLGKRDGLQGDGSVDSNTPLRSALELVSFKLAGGKLTRLGTTLLEDNVSGKTPGYLARMVDGTLVVYEAFYAFDADASQALHIHVPHALTYKGQGIFAFGDPLVTSADLFHPLDDPAAATFHLILRCTPGTATMACTGKGLVSDALAVTYVSPAAAYVYAAPHVYAVQLDSGAITAHKGDGAPQDGFGLSEQSGKLYALTVDNANASHLLSLSLAAFDTAGAQTLDQTTDRPLSGLTNVTPVASRFIDQSLVAIFTTADQSTTTKVIDLASAGVTDVAVSDTLRIEALDQGRALIMSNADTDLVLSVVALATGKVLATDSQASIDTSGMSEHGFFYLPAGDGSGTVGLGLLNNAVATGAGLALTPPEEALAAEGAMEGEERDAPVALLAGGYASVGYHALTAAGGLSAIGQLTSSEASDGACGTECVATYDNTRPVFINNHIFALLGTELTEGALSGGAIAATGSPLDFGP